MEVKLCTITDPMLANEKCSEIHGSQELSSLVLPHGIILFYINLIAQSITTGEGACAGQIRMDA